MFIKELGLQFLLLSLYISILLQYVEQIPVDITIPGRLRYRNLALDEVIPGLSFHGMP
jgi:hypothetical protein